jgi:hypothetical protein
MIRLLVAVGLVCALSYTFYPQECRLVAGRLEDEARSVAAGVKGAVLKALPHEEAPPPPPERPLRPARAMR